VTKEKRSVVLFFKLKKGRRPRVVCGYSIYILGLLWLGTIIGWDKPIIALGAKPFLLAEIFKVALLALITKKILKIRSFI